MRYNLDIIFISLDFIYFKDVKTNYIEKLLPRFGRLSDILL